MASSPSHRSSVSVSQTRLAPPADVGSSNGQRPRRMTSPSLPPPTPLDLPEPVTYGNRRPPSPLRNAVTVDPDTGEISEDGSMHESEHDEAWGERVTSPTPSMAAFAANFAQKFGSLVSNVSARSPNHLPTDEELEAEAEREREITRREAERILSREAETKRLEERVLAMLDSDMRRPHTPLQPPPSIPSNSMPPSPASSHGSSWLAAVKNKLTPTKEPLTPAQQIIQETKARDKEVEKEEKKLARERKESEKELKKVTKKQSKQRSGEWPSSPESKYNDPALLKLGIPSPSQEPLLPRPVMGSPSTPPRQRSMPPSLAPSPMRNDSSSSPARSGPPLYAQFNADGALDIPATLLTIASRFEKLEKWTVGHVRALEERMDDVERWLVEKEKEKDAQSASGVVMAHRTGEPATVDAAISELRDELAEVQGRIGELGREMAKMVTAPGNLSSGPSRSAASLARAPSTSSSIAVRSISSSITSAQRTPSRPKEPTSPPVTTPPVPSAASRTRLPYPTGDYATPPDSVHLSQGPFSPPSSPPSSDAALGRRVSISGLPSNSFDFTSSSTNSPSGLPTSRPQSPPSLPLPPEQPGLRRASVSPTPRKRYTVALGAPINSADRDRDHEFERPSTPSSRNQSRDSGTVLYSASPVSAYASLDTEDESDSGANDETIGKAKARNSGLSQRFGGRRDSQPSPSPSPAPTNPRRARPQSMYSGFASTSTHNNIFAPAPVAPLNTRTRSQSTDRFGLSLRAAESDSERSVSIPPTPTSGKFVDPLIRRKQTKEAEASAAPPAPKVMPGKPKVPVGQLVQYFDKGKA